MKPTVALLTDFGTRDPYAGAMKGAVLAACAEATLVDVAHDLPAHDVEEAAFCLASVYAAFPAGSVFVVVVDPEVGTRRRGLALDAGGYRFVGPDNGVFTLVLAEHPGASVCELTNTGLFRQSVAPTFHGRDVFAPVAGYLAQGRPLDDVGPPVLDPVRFALPATKRVGEDECEATVLHADRFGNLTTNLLASELEVFQRKDGADPMEIVVVVEGHVLPLVTTYAEVAEGEICALLGSSGRLELAVHRGNAARLLGAGRGAPVRVKRVPARRVETITVL